MKKLFICFVIIAAQVFSLACDKTKTIKQLEDVATQMRIHNRDLARVTNEFHSAGKLSNAFHLRVLIANSKLSSTLDGADRAITAARLATNGPEVRTALDWANRFISTEVFTAVVAIGESIVDIPAEVKAKIEVILASIRILFATIRSILADSGIGPRQEAYHA